MAAPPHPNARGRPRRSRHDKVEAILREHLKGLPEASAPPPVSRFEMQLYQDLTAPAPAPRLPADWTRTPLHAQRAYAVGLVYQYRARGGAYPITCTDDLLEALNAVGLTCPLSTSTPAPKGASGE